MDNKNSEEAEKEIETKSIESTESVDRPDDAVAIAVEEAAMLLEDRVLWVPFSPVIVEGPVRASWGSSNISSCSAELHKPTSIASIVLYKRFALNCSGLFIKGDLYIGGHFGRGGRIWYGYEHLQKWRTLYSGDAMATLQGVDQRINLPLIVRNRATCKVAEKRVNTFFWPCHRNVNEWNNFGHIMPY